MTTIPAPRNLPPEADDRLIDSLLREHARAGSQADEAFLALQDAISEDLGIVFTNLQSFEQVPKEEADEEVQEILQESIEEVLLSLPEGDA